MQRTAVIGGWRPLPEVKFCIYLAREIYFYQGKVREFKSQGILKTDVCGNHEVLVKQKVGINKYGINVINSYYKN